MNDRLMTWAFVCFGASALDSQLPIPWNVPAFAATMTVAICLCFRATSKP